MIYRLIAILIILFPLYAHAGVTGKPRVIDGDTLEIGGQRICSSRNSSAGFPISIHYLPMAPPTLSTVEPVMTATASKNFVLVHGTAHGGWRWVRLPRISG